MTQFFPWARSPFVALNHGATLLIMLLVAIFSFLRSPFWVNGLRALSHHEVVIKHADAKAQGLSCSASRPSAKMLHPNRAMLRGAGGTRKDFHGVGSALVARAKVRWGGKVRKTLTSKGAPARP